MHFIVTFGFSITIPTDTNAVKTKIKERNIRASKKKKNIGETAEVPKNVIQVGPILAELHVEYKLLPNYDFKFDLRCWDKAAKIYTENDDLCLRPIRCPIKENICWVLFSVHHEVHLNESQIKYLFNYVVTCHIFFGKQKLSERCKKDKVKGFYIDDEKINVGSDEFLQIYPLDLRQSSSFTKLSTPSLPEAMLINDEHYGDYSVATYVDALPDSMHEYKFRKMLRADRFPSAFTTCEPISTLNDSTAKEGKKSKKNSEPKKNKAGKKDRGGDKIQIELPAEVFFSDMGSTTIFNRTTQANLSSTLTYIYCQDILLNKGLRKNMNPISIKLDQLSNLPVDLLIKNGINSIYAKIFFVNRTIVTPCYNLSAIICFEFVKCFLCNEFQPDELINFLATEVLIVQIIGKGSSNLSSVLTTEQIGNGATTSIHSLKSPNVTSNEHVLLGVVEFDLSNLLNGMWEVKLSNNLIHPRNINSVYMNNVENVEEISWENSPLTNDVLANFCTTVKLKVRLASDLQKLRRKIINGENKFNRILFNLDDAKLANSILEDVSDHNSNLLCTCKVCKIDVTTQPQNVLKHVLTGFVIENSQRYYIFLEGLSNGYLTKIWEDVAQLPISQKRIYYNSNYRFLARVYEDFIPLGGILRIKLTESLEKKLRKCIFFTGQTRQTFQAIAVRKIGLINLTLTMQSLCQGRIFPVPNEVKSFIHNISQIEIQDICVPKTLTET